MHKHNFYLSLIVLCLLLLITACDGITNPISNSTAPTGTHSDATNSTIGNFKEYSLPKTGSGLMRPALDSKGRLWFGEMSHNFLTMFDTHTHIFVEITPPYGAFSVMGVVVASDDTIWFAEQDANYIGHYFPDTKHFQTYNLPVLHTADPNNTKNILTLPSGPNDLAFDAHGNLWFTEMNADAVGMLNTHTGVLKQYPLSSTKRVQTLSPYGITVDTHGMVWFTESTTNHIGRLDPGTGKIRLFTIVGSPVPLMEIASDPHGTIWATSFNANQLLQLDPSTGVFRSYTAPSATQGSGGLYGLTVTQSGEVWITVPAENALAHFDTHTYRFVYHAIPSPNSFPFGLVMDAQNHVWFTETGSDKIGMLQR
ncbi:MAG: hydrolase [Ktedonobacteraceae bacterium]